MDHLNGSLVDRSLRIVLENPEATPSRQDGVSSTVERLHRLHGTSLLNSAWRLLKEESVNSSCYITSCTLFHRFFHRVSLKQANVWAVAMASALLAAKLHDLPLSLGNIVQVFAHLHRRRLIIAGTKHEGLRSRIAGHPAAHSFSFPEAKQTATDSSSSWKKHLLKPQPMSPMGPVYQEWSKVVLATENQVLRELGYTIFWIPEQHAHKFLPYLLSIFEIEDKARCDISQRAWNYCNDSYRLDLATRYPPYIVACAAIHLSFMDCDHYKSSGTSSGMLGDKDTTPWWVPLIGADCVNNVSLVCNSILGLRDSDSLDAQLASLGFVVSLEGQSFNDHGSFISEQVKGQLESILRTFDTS